MQNLEPMDGLKSEFELRYKLIAFHNTVVGPSTVTTKRIFPCSEKKAHQCQAIMPCIVPYMSVVSSLGPVTIQEAGGRRAQCEQPKHQVNPEPY
jgi:hypothetical protein